MDNFSVNISFHKTVPRALPIKPIWMEIRGVELNTPRYQFPKIYAARVNKKVHFNLLSSGVYEL